MWDWDGDKIPVSGLFCLGGLATPAKTHTSLGRDLLLRPCLCSAVWSTWLAALDLPSRPGRRLAVRRTWLAATDLPSRPGRRLAVQTTWMAALDRPSLPGWRLTEQATWFASLDLLWWLGLPASAWSVTERQHQYMCVDVGVDVGVDVDVGVGWR